MVDDQLPGGEGDGAVPPRGGEIPHEHTGPEEQDALSQLLEQLLALVPDELRTRLTDKLRALLDALRAVIDWLLARLERDTAQQPSRVRDIPIL